MVELLLTQGMGLNVIPRVSSWGELALCAQSSCAVLCYVRRFLITLARQTHVPGGTDSVWSSLWMCVHWVGGEESFRFLVFSSLFFGPCLFWSSVYVNGKGSTSSDMCQAILRLIEAHLSESLIIRGSSSFRIICIWRSSLPWVMHVYTLWIRPAPFLQVGFCQQSSAYH